MDASYPASHLELKKEENQQKTKNKRAYYQIAFPEQAQAQGQGSSKAQVVLPFVSPGGLVCWVI